MHLRPGFILFSAFVVAFCWVTPSFARQSGETSQQGSADASPAKPTPDASGVYVVGHGVKAPEVLKTADAQYSEEARKHKVSAMCVVQMVVDVNGRTTEVSILKPAADSVSPLQRAFADGLDENAMAAVKQYRFKPATLHDVPVPVRISAVIRFNIR